MELTEEQVPNVPQSMVSLEQSECLFIVVVLLSVVIVLASRFLSQEPHVDRAVTRAIPSPSTSSLERDPCVVDSMANLSSLQLLEIEPSGSPRLSSSSRLSSLRSETAQHSSHETTTTEMSTSPVNRMFVEECFNDARASSANAKQPMTFEVKTSSFTRKIQVKTKQEESICRRQPSSSPCRIPSPTLTCSSTIESFSPRRIQIRREEQDERNPRTSTSNVALASIDSHSRRIEHVLGCQTSPASVRLRVTSPSQVRRNGDAVEEKKEKKNNNSDRNPSSSPFVHSISMDTNRDDTKARRPLFDLLNELRPSSPIRILPAKQLPPFQPIITHKKSPVAHQRVSLSPHRSSFVQESIGRFQVLDRCSPSASSADDRPSFRRNSRNAILRSQTFTSPTERISPSIASMSKPISSDESNLNEIRATTEPPAPATCQSTPELSSSMTSSATLLDDHMSLPSSVTSNTSVSNIVHPIDDKHEVVQFTFTLLDEQVTLLFS